MVCYWYDSGIINYGGGETNMLTEPQKEHLRESIRKFARKLTPELQKELHFRIDDIIQYGAREAALQMYDEINELRNGR